MSETQSVVRASAVFVLVLNCLAALASPQITNWYHVEVWRFPEPAQNPSDMSSLPIGRENIPYNESVHTAASSEPVDITVGGDTPRSGQAGASRHVARVKAASDFTHLRAAFETSVSNFLASNLRPGYYRDAEGNVLLDYGDFGGQTLVATHIDEIFTLSGPDAGPTHLTYVLNLSGSNSSNVAASGVGAAYLEPWTGGIISAYGAELYGPFIELPRNASVSASRSLTVQLHNNAPTFTRLAMSLQNYLLGYAASISDDDAAATYLNGAFNWNYDTTATVEKLIVQLPAGASPVDYTLTADSGTNYNIEFRVATIVPEPSTLAMLMVAISSIAVRRVTR